MARMFPRLVALVGLAGLPVAVMATPAVAADSSTNPAPITIPSVGAATPYPSSISVSGLDGLVRDVDVTIRNWTHSASNNVDILLVGPSGQSVVLVSDVGFGTSNVTLLLTDGAPALPACCISPNSGTYSPTNHTDADPDAWPAPAPPGPHGSALSAFTGSTPNGTWSLYAVDDASGGSGTIAGGWSLSITHSAISTSAPPPIAEGGPGTVATATFVLTMTQPNNEPVTVDFATRNGTATSPGDYESRSGTRTFLPGQTRKAVTVQVYGDAIDEPNETYFLDLIDADGAVVFGSSTQATIVDDDPTPPPATLAVSDATVTEGNSTETPMTFTISLSSPATHTVSVDFVTSDGSATSPQDYEARSGTRVFQPGQTSRIVTIFVHGEQVQEPDEGFDLTLRDPDGATISDGLGIGTILDDDRPTISINDRSVTEVNTGSTRTVSFTVSLSHAGTSTITVAYATANGTAVAPGDYTAKSGTLTFSPGQLSKTVSITTKGDNLDEPNETFFVNLANPVNATIADGQGVGTIVDND